MKLLNGDCLEQLKLLPDNSVDALVTDPPAGISFMGKDWDKDKGGRGEWVNWMTEVMRECFRVMKPGAHGLVWAIPRTSHWMAWACDDAGFEVRDVVTHLFGSGFPKSLDVSKAIDKAAGATREVVGFDDEKAKRFKSGLNSQDKGWDRPWMHAPDAEMRKAGITAPATDDAKQWSGWGTALKPASEHWILVRKPCSEKTVAANVLKWGTGAINIDASRVESGERPHIERRNDKALDGDTYGSGINGSRSLGTFSQGRFPANLLLSHSDYCADSQCDIECSIKLMDEQSGVLKTNPGTYRRDTRLGDSGGASRFFYVAKASKREKNAGLEGMPAREKKTLNDYTSPSEGRTASKSGGPQANFHPTVKAQKLMTYLCRLITPPGGTVLDPFAGSGSTGVAAIAEGWDFIGIEKDPDYFKILERRVFNALPEVEKRYGTRESDSEGTEGIRSGE